MSAYTPPDGPSDDYAKGVADERQRIAEALDRASSREDGRYSEQSRYVLEQWAQLVRGGDLP